MAAVIGALRADLSATVAQFEDDMGQAAKAVQQFGKRAQAVSNSLVSAGQRMTLALTTPFVALAAVSARAALESRDAIDQVQSRLASMGDASGRTAEQLQESAKELQRLSTFDDDDILRQVTNAMLTFGNVSGEVFDRAQRAAVDMSTSLGTDLQSSAILVGKALNNPIKGLTALTRIGVAFTNQQKAQITSLTESGRAIEAQGLILAELEREYKGAGEAARNTGADTMDAWREVQETIGEMVLQIIDKIEPFVVRVLDAFNDMTPGMQKFIVATAAVAAAIGPVLWALGAFVGAIANLAPLWASFVQIFADAALAAGITNVGVALRALVGFLGPIAAAIVFVVAAVWQFRGAIVEAFGYLVDHFQKSVIPALQNLWGAFSELFAAIGKLTSEGPLAELVKFVAWAVAELVALFVQGLGHAIIMVVSTIVDVLATVIRTIADLVGVVGKLLSGDFAGAWEDAKAMVVRNLTGILEAFDNIVPGISNAAKAAYEAVQEWIGDRIAETLAWIQARFPGLIDAVMDAARGATAWARNLYNGVKTWLVDNLGPQIEWAKNRIRELNNLFSWIKRRQNQVSGADAPPAPTEEPPATNPPRGGGGTPFGEGGGGGGGGRGRSGKSDAERLAERIAKATTKFRDALADVQDNIDKAFDRNALPRSMQAAKALRDRIAELSDEAREAGVSTGAFAAQIALLQTQINELETTGLQREAEEFARDVRDLAAEIVDFGGGLPPLEDKLRNVDDAYADLRKEIQDAITENRALADANEDAAAAMVVLERQLGALDAAHAKATEAARAQYEAEERLADLNAARDAADTSQAISDLRERRGEGGTLSASMQALQQIERELADQRMSAAIELASLEASLAKAEAENNATEVARLQTQIGLQQQLFDLVSNTSAEQIYAAERLQKAFENFVDGLSDELTDMIMDWEFDLDGIRDVFKQIARDLFIKPVVDSFSSGIGTFLKSFAGGFATGGTLSPGTWGIAGENGPEPIYAGASNLSVTPNDQAFGRGRGDVIFNVTTPNADSFRYSQRQLARKAKQTLGGGS